MLESVKRFRAAMEAAHSEQDIPDQLLHDVISEETQRVLKAVDKFCDFEIPFLMAALRFVALQLIASKEDYGKVHYEDSSKEIFELLCERNVTIVIPIKKGRDVK